MLVHHAVDGEPLLHPETALFDHVVGLSPATSSHKISSGGRVGFAALQIRTIGRIRQTVRDYGLLSRTSSGGLSHQILRRSGVARIIRQ